MDNTIPTELNFKKGDKLIAVVVGSTTLVRGQEYEATEDTEPGNHLTPHPFVFVKHHKGGIIGCYAWRFRKAEAV